MRQDIEMIRGDTLSFAIKITGLGQDLDTVFMSCKKFESGVAYIFQKSLKWHYKREFRCDKLYL